MLEKDCNGNPMSTFPPCYAFQIIFTALAPRLIQSISRNVHNKFRALKQLWLRWPHVTGESWQFIQTSTAQDLTLPLGAPLPRRTWTAQSFAHGICNGHFLSVSKVDWLVLFVTLGTLVTFVAHMQADLRQLPCRGIFWQIFGTHKDLATHD